MTPRELQLFEGLLFNEKLAEPDFFPLLVIPQKIHELDHTGDEDTSSVSGSSFADLGIRKMSIVDDGMLIHASTVSAKEANRLRCPAYPDLYYFAGAELSPGRRDYKGSFHFLAVRRNGDWRKVDKGRVVPSSADPMFRPDLSCIERALLLAALVRRYRWTVRLRVDDGQTIEFLTSSQEAREVFRWRDKPPGANRRAALRHWVSRLGSSGQRDPWYLRGAVDFEWEGVQCKLLPPAYDREKLITERVSK